MKRILATLFFALALSTAQFASAQTTATQWPEQTSFFTAMNAAYMAWKNNSSIDVVRQHADEIYSQAVAWKQAARKDLPKAAKKDMKKMVKLAKKLKSAAAKTGNDDVVRQDIANIHNLYLNVAGVAGGPTS